MIQKNLLNLIWYIKLKVKLLMISSNVKQFILSIFLVIVKKKLIQ